MRLRFGFSSDRLLEIGEKFLSNLFASHVVLPVPNSTANASGDIRGDCSRKLTLKINSLFHYLLFWMCY